MTNTRATHDPNLYQPRHHPSARALPRRAPALFEWLLGLGLLLCGPVVHADEAARHYAIPPQSLNDALMTFAVQSDLKLVVPADLIRGLPSPGLTGDHTPEQGLQHLLAGSGMRYRFVAAGTVTIERAPQASPPPDQGATEPRDDRHRLAYRRDA